MYAHTHTHTHTHTCTLRSSVLKDVIEIRMQIEDVFITVTTFKLSTWIEMPALCNFLTGVL